jgi:hypothetical protein
MPYVSFLVGGFPLWPPGFSPRSGHMRFVVDKVAVGGFPQSRLVNVSRYC